MEIEKGIKIKDLALIYKDHLIISDLHIGLEEALNKHGILIPRFQLKEIKQRLEPLLLKKIKVIVVKGNHDTILGPIADKRNLKVVDKYEIDDITIIHGNKIKEINTKIIIIGHEHPAVTIKDNIRNETYKCFLKGKYKNKILIVTPSFS